MTYRNIVCAAALIYKQYVICNNENFIIFVIRNMLACKLPTKVCIMDEQKGQVLMTCSLKHEILSCSTCLLELSYFHAIECLMRLPAAN